MWAHLPGLDPDSTRGAAVSAVARNLFDWLYFRHDTRQDTRGLPFGTIQGLPDPDKHCLHKGTGHEVRKALAITAAHRVARARDRNAREEA